jgi:hypothetical protein
VPKGRIIIIFEKGMGGLDTHFYFCPPCLAGNSHFYLPENVFYSPAHISMAAFFKLGLTECKWMYIMFIMKNIAYMQNLLILHGLTVTFFPLAQSGKFKKKHLPQNTFDLPVAYYI